MKINSLEGKPVQPTMLVNVPQPVNKSYSHTMAQTSKNGQIAK